MDQRQHEQYKANWEAFKWASLGGGGSTLVSWSVHPGLEILGFLGVAVMLWSLYPGWLAFHHYEAAVAIPPHQRPEALAKHEGARVALLAFAKEADGLSRENPHSDQAKSVCDGRIERFETGITTMLKSYNREDVDIFEAASIDATGNLKREKILIKRWSWDLDRLDSQRKAIVEILKRIQERLRGSN